ncbi:class A beta-lactamase-related serine hydrolase [Pseudomonas sp. 14P_8.1_Bac3]|uniref:class A beta-lactamase-related serine hydrolase n=1 Tax=Pseudomonas sp. 14P_8.1_Bac3 TaxID=2971621 RepID=UPI0021CA17C3|nr:class A beta-lactamase-related serine hydrolase [Pseudomonas sp. 14P_8.1_Bac3]MCU1758386.1 class A beta-lactamase-related serine hydrolase [Pseudomonas sp. 14P_8.1_Bac3]
MFFDTTPRSQDLGDTLVQKALEDYRSAGLSADGLGVTLLLHPQRLTQEGRAHRPEGFAYRGQQLFYPCSVVKAFYLVAMDACLASGQVQPHEDLERAMRDMIIWSSNTATNYVIDLITQTTGDTLLSAEEFTLWANRRQAVNRYFQSLAWPELAEINLCQKLMDDERYGREKAFVTFGGNNHNRLCSNAAARLMFELFNGTVASPERCRRMTARFHRPLTAEFAAQPAAQINGYFGANLPSDATLYSKAGWTGWTGDPLASYRRHDLGYVELPLDHEGHYQAFTLAVFTQGQAMSEGTQVLPAIARLAYDAVRAV